MVFIPTGSLADAATKSHSPKVWFSFTTIDCHKGKRTSVDSSLGFLCAVGGGGTDLSAAPTLVLGGCSHAVAPCLLDRGEEAQQLTDNTDNNVPPPDETA